MAAPITDGLRPLGGRFFTMAANSATYVAIPAGATKATIGFSGTHAWMRLTDSATQPSFEDPVSSFIGTTIGPLNIRFSGRESHIHIATGTPAGDVVITFGN